LARQRKFFSWPTIGKCPRCKASRLYRHGFVRRYFEPLIKPLWIIRYRCPHCNTVFTVRPQGYFPYIRYPISVIFRSIWTKLRFKKWITGVSRQLQNHWFRGFILQCVRYSVAFTLNSLLRLHDRNIPYCLHSSEYNETNCIYMSSHLPFSVTTHTGFT
jgi:hypothetical protein